MTWSKKIEISPVTPMPKHPSGEWRPSRNMKDAPEAVLSAENHLVRVVSMEKSPNSKESFEIVEGAKTNLVNAMQRVGIDKATASGQAEEWIRNMIALKPRTPTGR